jgi:hypothetical protein
MHQAPDTPGLECSTSQASEPGEKRERVRTISRNEQEALEHSPAFEHFSAWLYRLAQAALAKQKTTPPPEEAA